MIEFYLILLAPFDLLGILLLRFGVGELLLLGV
jgi:hypothetical protein